MFRYWTIFILAIKNVRLNWRHSVATMLAIVFGFTAVAMFDGFMSALNFFIEESYVNKGMVGHVILEKKGANEHLFEDPWLYSLSPAEQEKAEGWIRSDSRVKTYMKHLFVSGMLSNGKSNAIFIGAGLEETKGVEIRGKRWAWNTIAGKPLYLSANESFIMGKGLADRMGCSYDSSAPETARDGSYIPHERNFACSRPAFQLSATTESAQVNAMSLQATGIADYHIREFNDRLLALPLKAAQTLLDTNRITRFYILLKDKNQIGPFVAEMKKKAAQESIEATAWIDHRVAATSKGGLEILGVFRALFLSIVAIVSAMAVTNSMMKSVNERIREIGSLRSFGFRQRDIQLLFSFEGLLLGFVSCFLGVLVSIFLTFFIDSLGLSFTSGISSTPLPVKISVAFAPWLSSSFWLCLITFLSSWIVAYRASRMVVADALRYNA